MDKKLKRSLFIFIYFIVFDIALAILTTLGTFFMNLSSEPIDQQLANAYYLWFFPFSGLEHFLLGTCTSIIAIFTGVILGHGLISYLFGYRIKKLHLIVYILLVPLTFIAGQMLYIDFMIY
jgi:hypothetical protein